LEAGQGWPLGSTGRPQYGHCGRPEATTAAAWRVFGGKRPDALPAVATAPKRGFETAITAPARAYVAVQALDAKGHPLERSAVEKVG